MPPPIESNWTELIKTLGIAITLVSVWLSHWLKTRVERKERRRGLKKDIYLKFFGEFEQYISNVKRSLDSPENELKDLYKRDAVGTNLIQMHLVAEAPLCRACMEMAKVVFPALTVFEKDATTLQKLGARLDAGRVDPEYAEKRMLLGREFNRIVIQYRTLGLPIMKEVRRELDIGGDWASIQEIWNENLAIAKKSGEG